MVSKALALCPTCFVQFPPLNKEVSLIYNLKTLSKLTRKVPQKTRTKINEIDNKKIIMKIIDTKSKFFGKKIN